MHRYFWSILHPRGAAERMLRTVKSLWPESRFKTVLDAAKFWNDSSDDVRIQDLSHWLGKGRWADEQAWSQIGQMHYIMFKKLCLLAGTARPISSMVEWGPGGGANVVQFSSEVKYFYGIDISAANLAECQRQLETRGFLGFRPIQIDIRKPEQCLRFVQSPVEFFLSTAVYQHFSTKQYGRRITELAYDLLADNGIALIQIRYDDATKRYRPKYRNYRKNVVTFNSYGIVEFQHIVSELGFNPMAISLNTRTNYAYFFLKKGGEQWSK